MQTLDELKAFIDEHMKKEMPKLDMNTKKGILAIGTYEGFKSVLSKIESLESMDKVAL